MPPGTGKAVMVCALPVSVMLVKLPLVTGALVPEKLGSLQNFTVARLSALAALSVIVSKSLKAEAGGFPAPVSGVPGS